MSGTQDGNVTPVPPEPPVDPSTARYGAEVYLPSQDLKDWVRGWESYRGYPYDIDGGWTFGYGHREPYGSPNIPAFINEPDARTLFDLDIVQRGANRVYSDIVAMLTQQEFDALVSVAYNTTQKAWSQIAAGVNQGADMTALLPQFTYGFSKKDNKMVQYPGLVRRRAGEVAIWENGDYTKVA